MRTPTSILNVAIATRTAAVIGLLAAPMASFAQTAAGDAATIAALREQLAALTRRLEEVERRQAAQASAKSAGAAVQAEVREAQAAAKQAKAAAAEVKTAQRKMQAAPAVAPASTTGPIAGLLPYAPMGSSSSMEDALRSDLPGISLRIPSTNTEARLYGFAKVTAWQDFNARNQSDAPAVQTIPLNGSGADQQGGDFGISARFSRIGVDTRTLTDWGTLETRIEGDFGGGTATNATFRLRQAWGELGTEKFAILIGQANSLWNEGIFETLIDSTNLNQSFIRQAQIRLTARPTPQLTAQFSVEAPDTTYTSVAGVVNPGTTIGGGASPAFNAMPDFLGRLTYRKNGMELGGRALLRDLTVRTDGTAVSPSGSESAVGWGFAGHLRFPMRWISDRLGTDEFLAMAYYGDGIGRYFAGNTSGQDGLTDLGLPGTVSSFSLDTVQTWGATVAYRRFWTPRLRSNFAFSYARQNYPDYGLAFAPGSAAATSLNREMQQGIFNLIWSPFATVNNGVFGSGWLDLGIEYIYSNRTLFGGSAAGGAAGDGDATANRLLVGGVIRF